MKFQDHSLNFERKHGRASPKQYAPTTFQKVGGGGHKNEQPYVDPWHRCKVKMTSPCRISSRGQDFLDFQCFSNIKCGTTWWARKRIHYWCERCDRKIHPSRSPFVITRQASWCQLVILGTDFSIPPTHSWWILVTSSLSPHVSIGFCAMIDPSFYVSPLCRLSQFKIVCTISL